MTLTFLADGVENPANLERIDDAAALLGALRASTLTDHLIAVENAPGAKTIYGRRPLNGDATLAVGNERRGLRRSTLARADEIVVIPTLSRAVNTLNVAAAAAVAGWYVLHGSSPQPSAIKPETRRPSLLVIGDDHVEVGSTLRSAAAFGFRDVFLEDRDAGWFDGSSAVRREAYAAARRHKNALRVHRGALNIAARFDEIVVVVPRGSGTPLQRERLTHGSRQLVIVGARAEDVATLGRERTHVACLAFEEAKRTPLRLTASVALAEIARQVGRRRPAPGQPAPRRPAYKTSIRLGPVAEVLVVEAAQLLAY